MSTKVSDTGINIVDVDDREHFLNSSNLNTVNNITDITLKPMHRSIHSSNLKDDDWREPNIKETLRDMVLRTT